MDFLPLRGVMRAALGPGEGRHAALKERHLHFPLVVFMVCLLFTVVIWDHYFDSQMYYNRVIVSNLVLAMGTLLSIAFGLFSWSLESRKTYLEEEVKQRTDEAVEKGRAAVAAEARASEADRHRRDIEQAYKALQDTQGQLIQAEKLASVGRVVAGVAHELNNPLVTMRGFLRLLLAEDVPPKIRGRLDVLDRQASRCHDTVRDLLTISRKKTSSCAPVDLARLIDGVLEPYAVEFEKSGIRILRSQPPSELKLEGDAGQLERVISNLLVNAWDAVSAKPGPREIEIGLSDRGAAIELRVRDTGTGIPKENMSKIFDLFFTTKEAGKGTGLGLSLSRAIVEEHGGTIAVESKENQGTTFSIVLPKQRATPSLSHAAVSAAA